MPRFYSKKHGARRAAKIETMSLDGIEQILIGAVVTVTAFLLLRMMMLRLHDPFPLFTVALGLGAVFDGAAVFLGSQQPGTLELYALSLAVDFFLAPFVALELFRTVHPGEDEKQSWRFIGPIAASLFAGGFVVSYLTANPEKEAREGVVFIAFVLDTLMTFCVLGYLISCLRRGMQPVERNVRWLRRLFFLTTAADAIDNFVELNLTFVGLSEKPVHLTYVGFVIVITAACAFALRKPRTEDAPASTGTPS